MGVALLDGAEQSACRPWMPALVPTVAANGTPCRGGQIPAAVGLRTLGRPAAGLPGNAGAASRGGRAGISRECVRYVPIARRRIPVNPADRARPRSLPLENARFQSTPCQADLKARGLGMIFPAGAEFADEAFKYDPSGIWPSGRARCEFPEMDRCREAGRAAHRSGSGRASIPDKSWKETGVGRANPRPLAWGGIDIRPLDRRAW